MKNALWGVFIADAMAMPVHWYYQRKYIKEGFDGGIRGYEDAPHPHPESFMVGNNYHPNIAKAKELGRPFDIAHEHIRFYNTNYNNFNIKLAVHAGEHKNAMPEKEEPMSVLKAFASKVQRTQISGAELSKTYAEHNGPGNIPKNEMWKIHTRFSDKTVELDALMKEYEEDEILGTVFTTGCYPEQSLPV